MFFVCKKKRSGSVSDRFYFVFAYYFYLLFYACLLVTLLLFGFYSNSAIFAVICSFVMPSDFNSSLGS